MRARLHGGASLRLANAGRRPALLQAWDKTVRVRGDVRAILDAADGRSCTFRELDLRSRAWLASLEFHPPELAGRAVVFAVPNGVGWMEIFLGLRQAGAIAVPLDPGEPPEAQRRVAEKLRAGFWWDGARLQRLEKARRFRDPATCLIKLTSGTTGRPRPLVFFDEEMLADARQVTQSMGIRARDLNYALIPFGHSYGLGNLTLPLIAHGVSLVCGGAPLPHAIADDFRRWQPTVFPSVPAVFRALAAAEIEPAAFTSLRVAISAGAPLPPEVARDFGARFNRRLHSFYGSSETGGIAYDRSGVASLKGSVGTAMHGVRITRLPGGRLRVCSAAVVTHGNPRRMAGIGCWSPPDLASLDAAGHITLLGRRGNTVKIAGRRVNLGEIAARLKRLEGVGEVWVGVSNGSEPTLGAAVASNRTAIDLRTELQADTAAWKIPKKWAVMTGLPLSDRGKIDARALQAKVFGAE